MAARIYSPAKTAMQSGKAKTGHWMLEFDPAAPRRIDPLMGYTSSTDMPGTYDVVSVHSRIHLPVPSYWPSSEPSPAA